MNGIPLLAIGIYTVLFVGGVAGIIYGFRNGENNQKRNYFLILLGVLALAYVAWGLISRYLIISNLGDISTLILFRNALAVLALIVGLALLYLQCFGKGNSH
jgi:hypothetical protein